MLSMAKQLIFYARMFKNIIQNGNFANGTSGWKMSVGSPTFTVSGGEATINPTGIGETGIESNPIFILLANHVYYGCGNLKSTSNLAKIQISNNVDYAAQQIHSGSGNYERLSVIYTKSNTYNGCSVNINETGTAIPIYAKNILMIDLTATFGAGFEPTKDWCDANIPQNIIW